MRLPNPESIFVEEKKIKEYRLNPGHKQGRSKAAFFQDKGFHLSHSRQKQPVHSDSLGDDPRRWETPACHGTPSVTSTKHAGLLQPSLIRYNHGPSHPRAVSSAGEHLLYTQRVAGSNPARPTMPTRFRRIELQSWIWRDDSAIRDSRFEILRPQRFAFTP